MKIFNTREHLKNENWFQRENNDPPEENKPKDYQFKIPLAEALRPSDLEDFVGQEKAIGSGTLLRKLLDAAEIPNLILWGPPGCGKVCMTFFEPRTCFVYFFNLEFWS